MLLHPIVLAACLCLTETSFSAVAQQPRLPDLSPKLRLSALAERVAGYTRGKVLATKRADDGYDYPLQIRAWHMPGGTVPHDRVVDVHWDEHDPPILHGNPSDRSAERAPLCFFDANMRLLLVSYEHHSRSDQFVSQLGMARVPSERFTEEELDWAWLALRNHPAPHVFLAQVSASRTPAPWRFSSYLGVDAGPGSIELFMRLAGPEEKESYLTSIQWKASPACSDLEAVELCTSDPHPWVHGLAVHILLDLGLRVDLTPALDEDSRMCARAALGDHACQEKILARLARAEKVLTWDPRAQHSIEELEEFTAIRPTLQGDKRIPALVEIAAYGSAAALPALRTFVNKRVGNSVFAWLRLGGSVEELLKLVGGDDRSLPVHELTRASTLDALRLSLELLGRRLDEYANADINDALHCIEVLIDRLNRREPKAVLDLARPALNALIEQAPFWAARVRLTLLRAGDLQPISDLQRIPAGKFGCPRDLADALADVPGDQVVAVLVKLLLGCRVNLDNDDTQQGSLDEAWIASVLHRRSDSDRALALSLLEAGTPRSDAARDHWLYVRWALGELPPPAMLPELEHSEVVDACQLSLATEQGRYAARLSELRKAPKKYWWQLGLLHDDVSLPDLGRWLREEVDAGRSPYVPLLAIRWMGAAEGAQYLYPWDSKLWQASEGDYFTTLGAIESSANLSRLAARCIGSEGARQPWAWHALLVLLGRRV